MQAQGGPDLFTPNPSLLHHLPQQNGASHGLVNTTQSSASTSGGGSAGRAGYQGGSAGSGGGYTVRPLVLYGRELIVGPRKGIHFFTTYFYRPFFWDSR